MAVWTTIPDSDVDPESPITTSLMQALRDNPIALGEGASGSPSVSRSFSVHRNGVNQTSVGTALTKIRWTVELFDTNSDFEIDADDSGGATESRYTPTAAGKYLLSVTLYFLVVADLDVISVQFLKNGVSYAARSIVASGTGGQSIDLTTIADMDGSSDYIEVFAQNASNADTVLGTALDTFFTGSRMP